MSAPTSFASWPSLPTIGPLVMRALRNATLAALLAGCQATVGLVLGEQAPDAAAGADATTVETSVSDAGGGPEHASPVVVELSGDATTSKYGSETGGMPFLDLCPDGEAVVEVQGSLQPGFPMLLVSSIQGSCASMAVDPSSGQVTTAPGTVLPLHGTGPADAWTQTCPAGQVVVGFVGRSGIALDQAAFECTSLAVNLDAGSFSMGPLVVLVAAGGDGGLPFRTECPAGQLAHGLVGRSGDWIDEFGIACASPTLGGSDR
jgi:hypothetical protein